VGLSSYKKVLHPARTARRAAVRSVTPKPIRKARRAVTQVGHPLSSLEGAAKASVSRGVRPRHRSRAEPTLANKIVGTFFGAVILIALLVIVVQGAIRYWRALVLIPLGFVFVAAMAVLIYWVLRSFFRVAAGLFRIVFGR
jgi:hypothetical protein